MSTSNATTLTAANPTIEQLQAEIDRLNSLKPENETSTSADALAEDTEQTLHELANGEEPQTGDVAPAIDQAIVTLLRQMLDKAVASNFFMSNPKRVATLESAVTIPVSDDKSFQQYYTHSEKDLLAESYRDARKSGGTPVEVTNALVMAEAQKRYMKKHGKHAVVNEEYEA